ncbi:ABC transporter substrate-binding protein [Scytonema sp. UIC 10036]|uniref:ABC transporter substrate-binding protein n=1 Tax=Scytonema sp. UIC 10036 TaxID=2304196 RepID=UPI0012DA450B|nr:ABC transporter substrate-binding protein [Scytonema sp. UIC 10036]MUG96204.1 ABC transporter substrate-binding protein [Scytonema sp. UIC 10036]
MFPVILRKRLMILVALLSTIAIASCNPANFKTQAAVPQIVVSTLSDPKTFNYALNSEAPNVFTYIYEGLVAENGITGEVEPALAESWDISPDKQRIVFTLRNNLKWSDGQPLTADDVVFSYNEIYFNKEIPTSIKDVVKIGENDTFPKVQKLSDRQVEFTLPEPFAPFLRNAAVAILPAHALRESIITKDSEGRPQFLAKWGTDTHPAKIICNGPYRMVNYATSERIIFERNPYYWRKDDQGNPMPYIQRFIWKIVESTDTSLLQFRSGGLDALGISPEYFALLKRGEKRGKYTIYNGGPTLGTSFIAFNLNKGQRNGKPLVNPIKSRWFNQLEFRQAVAYAIDRETMNQNIFQGLGELQNSPISVQSPYYITAKDGLKVYNYNPKKAQQLLLKAGFKYNQNNQLLDADGNRVRFTMITNSGNKIREAMGSQIKQDLSKIGIQVDFAPLAFNTLIEKLNNTIEWECYLLGFTGSIEPNEGANIWAVNGSSHRFNQPAKAGTTPIVGREISDWEKEIHRLYIKGAQELDENKRKAIYAETQRITQENLPFIYLINPLSMSAVRDRIKGIKYSALGGSLWNIHELQVTKDTAN